MPNSISLLELFPDLGYSEAARELLAQNKILDADLRPDEREVSVCVHSEVYLPASLLRQTEEEACKRRGPAFPGGLRGRCRPDP